MRVLLANSQTKLYYASRNRWVAAPLRARDFHRIQRALELAAHRNLGRVEVVLVFERPVSEMALPLSFARQMEQAQIVVSAVDPACLPGGSTNQRRNPAYARA